MFAVLKTGGKQYRVATGDVLRVEKLAADAGEKVQFNEVMMIGGDAVTIGAPLIDGAAVQADVIDQIRGEKLIHFVKRRRKHGSQRTKGHRQYLTLLRVTDILPSGSAASGVKVAVGAGSAPSSDKSPADFATKPSQKPVRAPVAKKASSTVASVGQDGGAGTAGVKPSNLLTGARDGESDDLKRISGVGPKLEALLHENGVFHFDQIVAWTTDEIAYMDDKLSFKGRIERDGWVDQAKQFVEEQE